MATVSSPKDEIVTLEYSTVKDCISTILPWVNCFKKFPRVCFVLESLYLMSSGELVSIHIYNHPWDL